MLYAKYLKKMRMCPFCNLQSSEILKENALEITPDNEEILKQIAMTAMTGKGAENSKETFANIVVEAVRMVREEKSVDMEDIKIEKSLYSFLWT